MKLFGLFAILVVCACYISSGKGGKYLVEIEETEQGHKSTREEKKHGEGQDYSDSLENEIDSGDRKIAFNRNVFLRPASYDSK